MPTHIFIQHGMWDLVSDQNMRAYKVARDLWQTGDSPGDMAHSLDWGQYGFLQRGDYAKAREAIQLFDEMVEMSTHARASSARALARARYIVETEEWKVQPLPDDASEEAMLANAMSAVRTGDLAAAEQAEQRLAAKAGKPAATGGGGAHADHGAAPMPASGAAAEQARGAQVMHREVSALIRLAKGQKDEAVTLLQEAVKIEETMRPPNGAADPIKPSHELLGEVLLEVGKPADAAKAFDTCLLRMPNRARSLLGSARAHAAAGDRQTASERFSTLQQIWKGRSDLPGFREAQRFLTSADERR
jgi:tetratricopeptide (TPR) repeat protein